MKHLRGHYLLSIFAVIVTLLVGAICYYMSHTVDVSIEKSAQAREAVRAANINKNREQAFLETYEKTERDWAKLPGFLVSSDNVVKFIEAVESLGKSAGSEVKLSSIDADNLETSKKSTTGSIRAHVEAEGSWSSVMRTLKLAEILPYKVSVSNVRLVTSGTGSEGSVRNAWYLTFDIRATMIANKSI